MALSLAIVACGGREAGDDGSTPGLDSGATKPDTGMTTDSGIDTGLDTGAAPDTGGSDVPIMGDPCKLDDGTATCGVSGCSSHCTVDCAKFEDASGTISPFGVCQKDFPSDGVFPAHPCTVCGPGDMPCARVDATFYLVCVQPSVCSRLAADGLAGACVFQDKSPWDAAPIADVACPAGGASLGLCGGGCPSCTDGSFCTGRSHRNATGICAPIRQDTSTFNSCGFSSKGDLFTRCKSPGDACVIFNADDQKLANQYGFCISADRCTKIEATIPEVIQCLDASGHSL